MNKQLTKKTIGIAASAALMATLAFSGSAFAAPGNGKAVKNGPKGSIEVYSVCTLNDDKSLTVQTIIMDASSNPGDAKLDSMKVTAVEKGAGRWSTTAPLASAEVAPTFTISPYFADCELNGDCNEANIPLCPPAPSTDARSINAEIEVLIDGEHNNKEIREVLDADGNVEKYVSVFTARCSDDPETENDEVAALNIGNQSKVGAYCN